MFSQINPSINFSINTYEQDMIEVGNEKKNQKQRHMELLSSYAYVIIVGGKSLSTLNSYG